MYTEQEMKQAEDTAESELCPNCNIGIDEKDCSSCEDFMRLRDSNLPQADIRDLDKITTEMMEHICDNLCRFPKDCNDQEETDSLCAECKMGRFVCDILNSR